MSSLAWGPELQHSTIQSLNLLWRSQHLVVYFHSRVVQVKEHMFGAQVRLSWPLLTSGLAFPLTQVGNTTRRTLVISNPGTHDHLMVQLVLENTYPSVSSLVNSLPQRYSTSPLSSSQF